MTVCQARCHPLSQCSQFPDAMPERVDCLEPEVWGCQGHFDTACIAIHSIRHSLSKMAMNRSCFERKTKVMSAYCLFLKLKEP